MLSLCFERADCNFCFPLKRHFAVVSLPEPRDSTLTGIVDAILDGNMHKNNGQSLAQELHEAIVAASCQLLTSVQAVLRPSMMPGRHHYMFTLRDLTKAFQVKISGGLLPDERRYILGSVSKVRTFKFPSEHSFLGTVFVPA